MNTPEQNPYRGITPEELHIAIQRAQAERAKAIREFFAGLFAWRKPSPQEADAPGLKVAACQ